MNIGLKRRSLSETISALIEQYENGKIKSDEIFIAILKGTLNSFPKANIFDLMELKDKVKVWWDLVYPEDIFDGSSGDEGALKVVEIRELIKKIERRWNDV